MRPSSKLLVIIPDRLSDLAEKGEVTDRYYNPGDLFEEVHLLLTNDDRVDPVLVQKTVGSARVCVHNLPLPSFWGTLCWRRPLLRAWVREGIDLAQRIGPSLIRTHGNFANGYLASEVKKALGVPLVTSLHTHPDTDVRGVTPWRTPGARIFAESLKRFERATLGAADLVLPVYESIRPYAERFAPGRVRVVYNTINPSHLTVKTDYTLSRPPRILSVGRQIPSKNAENLIRAVSQLDAELTIVGNGPLHGTLKEVARESGAADRITFLTSMANDALCRALPTYDVFAVHCDFLGIPKTILEAMLSGLPVVTNRRPGEQVPELQGDWVRLVRNTPEDYRTALGALLSDDGAREQLGRRAHSHALSRYAPEAMEATVAELYRGFLSSNAPSSRTPAPALPH